MQTYWLRQWKTHKRKGSDLKSDMTTLAESVETEEDSDSFDDMGLGFGVDTDQTMNKIERL
eukprot:scaffold22902_cov196-Cylindrotheca_fusiformis.AAC.1